MKYFLALTLLIFCVFVKADELVFVLEICRHGARAPLQNKYSQEFKVDTEMLTASGRRQHYLIGRFLRDRYIDRMKFLSPTFKHNEVHVTSTHIARTIESARSHMLGFYPTVYINNSNETLFNLETSFRINFTDFDTIDQHTKDAMLRFTPIPVFNKEFRTDTMISTGACPYLFVQESTRQRDTSYWNDYYNYFRPRIFQKISDIPRPKFFQFHEGTRQRGDWAKDFTVFKIPIENITVTDGYFLSDVLLSKEFEGILLKSEFTEDEWKDIERLQITGLINFHSLLGTKLMISKLMNPAIEFMRLKMGLEYDSRLTSSFLGTEKYIYFSSHDMLIAHIIKFFQPENIYLEFIEYASQFLFELYKDNEGKYYLQILFNNKPIKLPGCKTSNCTYEEFELQYRETGLLQDEVFKICNSVELNTTNEEWF